MLAILFLALVILSEMLFLTKESSLMKIAAGLTFTNTFILFVLMYSLRSTTFTLTLYDIAPIITLLVLLICDVAVLLLWQQLQLKEKKLKRRLSKLGRAVIFAGVAMLMVLGIVLYSLQTGNRQEEVTRVSQLAEVQEFKKAVEENGRSKFSIAVDRRDGQYPVIKVFESFPDHITTFNWYRVDKKSGKIEKQNIATDTWEEVSN